MPTPQLVSVNAGKELLMSSLAGGAGAQPLGATEDTQMLH